MPSLKEIRSRINSISNTRKITGAMKMVSSAKLHRGQDAILRFRPYWKKISGIMDAYLENVTDIDFGTFTELRKPEKVAIIVLASNAGLCGAYNANVQKKLQEVLNGYATLSPKNISIYFIGKKGCDEFICRESGYTISGQFPELADKPNYQALNELTDDLMKLFYNKSIDKVEIVYNKFKNTAVQNTVNELLLPIILDETTEKRADINYIIEPDVYQLSKLLVPTVIRLKMYNVLLNSYASEHGARTTAMQIATDNADELIDSLKLQYNKLRQNAITNEILDIVGGSEVLR